MKQCLCKVEVDRNLGTTPGVPHPGGMGMREGNFDGSMKDQVAGSRSKSQVVVSASFTTQLITRFTYFALAQNHPHQG